MGTRNKTIIVLNGQEIVNQYGQWDGYPTNATASIVYQILTGTMTDFIKNIERINYVDNEWISKRFERHDKNFPGLAFTNDTYNYIAEKSANLSQQEEYSELNKRIEYLMETDDQQLVADYFTLCRDTGYKIMEAVNEIAKYDVKINLLLSDYEGFDLEAWNTINLDNMTLKTNWHGHEVIWPFRNLPGKEELEKLEEEY